MKNIAMICIAVVILLLAWALEAIRPQSLLKYSLIHMDAEGHCPDQFVLMPEVFEKAGKRYAGCARTGSESLPSGGMIDRIDPGESVRIH
jgi:hypothetical protein